MKRIMFFLVVFSSALLFCHCGTDQVSNNTEENEIVQDTSLIQKDSIKGVTKIPLDIVTAKPKSKPATPNKDEESNFSKTSCCDPFEKCCCDSILIKYEKYLLTDAMDSLMYIKTKDGYYEHCVKNIEGFEKSITEVEIKVYGE